MIILKAPVINTCARKEFRSNSAKAPMNFAKIKINLNKFNPIIKSCEISVKFPAKFRKFGQMPGKICESSLRCPAKFAKVR